MNIKQHSCKEIWTVNSFISLLTASQISPPAYHPNPDSNSLPSFDSVLKATIHFRVLGMDLSPFLYHIAHFLLLTISFYINSFLP